MGISFIVFFYFIIAIMVGYFILKEVQEPSYRITKKNKRLGPSYWGVYEGFREEHDSLKLINPPPCVVQVCSDAGGSKSNAPLTIKSL